MDVATSPPAKVETQTLRYSEIVSVIYRVTPLLPITKLDVQILPAGFVVTIAPTVLVVT